MSTLEEKQLIGQKIHTARKNKKITQLQLGKMLSVTKKAISDYKILFKIVKNKYNYDLIVQRDDGVYDILHIRGARNITEDYGLRLNSCVDNYSPGDTIPKDSFIYRSDNFDDDSNKLFITRLPPKKN